jgi:hypothetical protein
MVEWLKLTGTLPFKALKVLLDGLDFIITVLALMHNLL